MGLSPKGGLWLGGVCALALASWTMIGCGGPAGTTAEPETGGATSAPVGTEVKGDIEVQAFKGGFGIDFYQKAADEFNKKHTDAKVTVDGDPRVWEKLKPRLVAGDPPALMFPGWGMDHWSLITDGALMELDAALDSPAEGADGTWRSTFEPGLLKLGQQEGKTYVLPYYFNINGWWYDKTVFDANGWTAPKNYDELLALCEKIKAKGIAPITYQGKYPYYMVHGMLLPWAHSVGGPEVIRKIQNLEPGAWKDPAVLKAAQMIVELRDKGYFATGATALTHTESQSDLVVGKAAMIPCGTWLYSEMKEQLKPTNKLTMFLPPPVAGGQGDPSAMIVSIEPWMVPSKSPNASGAIAFFKYMTSPEKAREFVAEKGSLMAIKGSAEAVKIEALEEPARLFGESKDVWSWQVRDWYKAMHTEIENALTAMLNGELTAEQLLDRCEAAAEATRKDSAIVKHKV